MPTVSGCELLSDAEGTFLGISALGGIMVAESSDSLGGSWAAGEGGGSTKAGGSCSCDGPGTALNVVLNAGGPPKDGEGGTTSVSNAGITLLFPLGDAGPKGSTPP